MNNLKRIRTSKNFTQAKLSELTGISVRMIQNYEQGFRDINNVKGITLYKLSQSLGCNIEDLLELTEEPERG